MLNGGNMDKFLNKLTVVSVILIPAIFIAGCGNSRSSSQQQRLRLEISAPATRGSITEPQTTIAGTISEPTASVTINDTPVTVDSEGKFTMEMPLSYGINRAAIRAEAEGFTSTSRTVSVTRVLTLELTSPEDKSTVGEGAVMINGKVSDPQANVQVLGIEVPVTDTGEFSHRLPLHYPQTIINVSATVEGTNPVSSTVTVFRG